jgi:hypothetical protein
MKLNSWKEKARGLGAAKVKDDSELAATRAGLCLAITARDDAQAVDCRLSFGGGSGGLVRTRADNGRGQQPG